MIHAWLTSLYARPFGVWGAAIEILILAAIIHVALTVLRGTRGAGILRGLVIIFFAGFAIILSLTHLAGLENIRWIMEYLLAISIFALIVLFQPEIRRGLVRIGENPVWEFFGGRGESLAGEVVKAVSAMAKKNIGAIIAIERDTSLNAFIEGGIVVDAPVNSELLATIFTPKSPLHDGAVIIRSGRIAAANSLLPFTENTAICRGMGARHRAAIGLSEESDAFLVIVSEETGRVSAAFKGEIMQGLDAAHLAELLDEHCAAALGQEEK